MLKNLVKDLKPSSTLAINETSRQLEQQGKKIFKFGFGQSPFKVPEDVVEELKSNAYQNKYLPMQGLEELREPRCARPSGWRRCRPAARTADSPAR